MTDIEPGDVVVPCKQLQRELEYRNRIGIVTGIRKGVWLEPADKVFQVLWLNDSFRFSSTGWIDYQLEKVV